MNKIPIIIGAIFGVIIILLIVYFTYNQQQTFRWYPSYKENGDQPYDLGLLNKHLRNSYKMQSFQKRLAEELPKNATEKSAYLFIGETPFYTEAEAEMLRDYVRAGGKAFIATNRLPDSLIQFLIYGEECGSYDDFWRGDLAYEYGSEITTRFEHPALNTRKYKFESANQYTMFGSSWMYIESKRLCDQAENPMATVSWIETSQNGTHANCVEMRVGEGFVYFHTNPILFTNYYFAKPEGFEYLTKLFAYMDTDVLYWDRASSLPPIDRPFQRPRNNFASQRSPMQYIYSEQSLRWAWYLMLTLGIIYALFHAKRRQRIIPILEPNRNTSLEFVQTIGRLYFQQQDHRSILLKQMQLFLSHLRQRYHIVLRGEWDDNTVKRIAIRSGVKTTTIETIFKEYNIISEKLKDPEMRVSAATLNRFYLMIEKFHEEENLKTQEIIAKAQAK